MSTLLDIITDPSEGAAVLCGLPNPTTIIGSSDPNVPILLRLANQEGRELARRHDWQALLVDYTVATLGAELQTALPSDFDHLTSDAEIWNRSTNQMYNFPTDAKTWGRVKGFGITSGSPGWARLLGGALYITPAPTAAQTIAFPYQSTEWISGKTAFTADTDVPLIPARLITLGIIWRWRSNKGFDYAEALSTYEREVERATSRDRGLKVLRPGAPKYDPVMNSEWSWPGTVTQV